MKKYRRIEVNAYRRRVTVASGEWQAEPILKEPAQTDDAVLLMDTDSSEPIEPDSPEGQLILVEAVRSLERRLSPEARATTSDTSRDLRAEPEEFNPETEKGQCP